jgi:hypothetical protein
MLTMISLANLNKSELKRLSSLISSEEVQAIVVLWGDRIGVERGEEEQKTPLLGEDITNKFLEGTMGVDEETRMSKDKLYRALSGAKNANGEYVGLMYMNLSTPSNGWYAMQTECSDRDINFKAQTSANENVLKGVPISDPGFVPLELHWHQLAAIHRLLAHVSTPVGNVPEFTPREWAAAIPGKDRRHHRQGFLIADEVGVGKSAQVLGFLSQIIYWKDLEKQGRSFPLVHCKCPDWDRAVLFTPIIH